MSVVPKRPVFDRAVNCGICPIEDFCNILRSKRPLKKYYYACFLLGHVFDELTEIVGIDEARGLMSDIAHEIEKK